MDGAINKADKKADSEEVVVKSIASREQQHKVNDSEMGSAAKNVRRYGLGAKRIQGFIKAKQIYLGKDNKI
jgi:hypothetical protein